MQYLVHIGYPKAASSFLQSTVFSGQDENIKPLLKDGEAFVGYQKSGGRLFFDNPENDEQRIGALHFNKKAVQERIDQATQKGAKVTALSNELWCGHPFSGGITAKACAERIHQALPKAKILILFRNQVDEIFSSYVHYISKRKGYCSLDHFLNGHNHSQVPFHHLSYYYYEELIAYYIDLFGKKNVLALPFEVLKQQGANVLLEKVYGFVKQPVNTSFKTSEQNKSDYFKYYSVKKLSEWAKQNPIHYLDTPNTGLGLKLFQSLPIKGLLSSSIKKQVQKDKDTIRLMIHDDIAKHNKVLQEFTSEDLQELGYIVES